MYIQDITCTFWCLQIIIKNKEKRSVFYFRIAHIHYCNFFEGLQEAYRSSGLICLCGLQSAARGVQSSISTATRFHVHMSTVSGARVRGEPEPINHRLLLLELSQKSLFLLNFAKI